MTNPFELRIGRFFAVVSRAAYPQRLWRVRRNTIGPDNQLIGWAIQGFHPTLYLSVGRLVGRKRVRA